MNEWPRNDIGRYACPCCGWHTLLSTPPESFEICDVCSWEDDEVQWCDPSYAGGANRESLQDARLRVSNALTDVHLPPSPAMARTPAEQVIPRVYWK
ncbi:MAG: hypothetical protein KF864_10705 [Phycisphaeraceae bacterium]|nr:hypothetical protein [Phycisphaeraceae bacterium]